MNTNHPGPLTHNTLTVTDLLSQLEQRGCVCGSPADAVAALDAGRDSTPVIVQLLIGAGAWIACGCIVLGLGLADILENGAAAALSGAALSGAAVFLRRIRTGVFADSFSLCTGLTGLVLFTVGVTDLAGGSDLVPGVISLTLAAAVLYVPFDSPMFRFLSVSSALVLLTVSMGEELGTESIHVLILLETLGAGFIFTKLPQPLFRPLGYALAVAMPCTLLLTMGHFLSVWPAAIVQVCAQLWLLNFALSTGQPRRVAVLGLSGTAAALLGLLSAPGILAATGLIILGHLERDALLRALGLLFLPVYLIAFYYNLDTSLLTKSGILIATGVILWAARWYLRERVAAGLFETLDLPDDPDRHAVDQTVPSTIDPFSPDHDTGAVS